MQKKYNWKLVQQYTDDIENNKMATAIMKYNI